ncbi:MAG: hypothetical protein ABI678_23565 [Kofleriaceae bacterium]
MRQIVLMAAILVARTASADAPPPDVQHAIDEHHLSHVLAADAKLHGFLFAAPECARFQKAQTLAAKDRDAFDACIDRASPRVDHDRIAIAISSDAGRDYAVWFDVRVKGDKIVELVGADASGTELDHPTVYEGQYSAFTPSEATRKELGARRAFAEVRVCSDASGTVTSRRIVKKSGIASFDAEVEAHFKTVKTRDPLLVAKTGVRVCRRLDVYFPVAPPAIGEKIESATPTPSPPTIVAPTLLEPLRIAGTKMIVPDDKTRTAIEASGREKVIASLKLCLDSTGAVSLVKLIRSSGFTAYDQLLDHEMHGWKYKPYVDHGAAIPVCTAVTFIYAQR